MSGPMLLSDVLRFGRARPQLCQICRSCDCCTPVGLLFVKYIRVKSIVFRGGRQCDMEQRDMERRGVAVSFVAMVFSLVLAEAVPVRLLCYNEINGVDLEPDGFFCLPMVGEDFVEVVFLTIAW